MYTILGFSDLFLILHSRTLSIWEILASTLKGESFANIVFDLSNISVTISSIFWIDPVLYLLFKMSEMSRNNFLPPRAC